MLCQSVQRSLIGAHLQPGIPSKGYRVDQAAERSDALRDVEGLLRSQDRVQAYPARRATANRSAAALYTERYILRWGSNH